MPDSTPTPDIFPADPADPLYVRSHPKHSAAVEAHAARLRAAYSDGAADNAPAAAPDPRRVLHGRYTNVSEAPARGAAAPRTQPVGPAPLPPDLDRALYDKDDPRHAEAVRAYARSLEDAYPNDRPDERTIQDLRAEVGIRPPTLPAPMKDSWSEEAEGDVLAYAATERIPGRIMEAVRDWYVDRVIVRGLDGIEAEFREKFAGRMAPHQIDTLAKWGRTFHALPDPSGGA